MMSTITLASCSDDNFGPDPEKDWQGTTEFFQSVEEKGYQTYYKPALGTVGDPMPFYDKKAGDFKVMYLQEYADNLPLRFHPYWTVSTKDCANYQSLGEWLSIGSFDSQQDAILGTGCCNYNDADNLYYIYYTAESGKTADRQVVMRATSPDLKTWTRDNSWSIKGRTYGYSTHDFRDPQIFTVGNEYHMIVSTYPSTGGDPCFAEFKSSDMKNWEHVGRFKMVWDRMLECPDVFEMGGKWYLVYSDMTEGVDWARKVKYMMGDSWEDLKSKFNDPGANWPERMREGTLDARAFYAGKTASNGTDRFIWGWCPTRPNNDNANVGNGSEGQAKQPSWSGALVCHKVAQNADGTLYLTAVPAIAAKYNKPTEVKVMKEDAGHILYNRLGYHNHISFTVKLPSKDDIFGVSFGRGDGNDKYVSLRFNNIHWDAPWNDEKKNLARTAFFVGDEWIGWAEGNFYPQAADNTYNIDIYTDNSIVVLYVNGTGCMTNRIYGIQNNCWSIDKFGNDITISDVKVSQY